MAPKKRAAKQVVEPVGPSEPAKPVSTSSRVTRSSARLAPDVKVNSTAGEAPPELPKRKKAKLSQKENGEVETEKEKVEVDASGKTIVIEHCKQCQSFKNRAIQVQKGLNDGVSGITVLINPDKPRRGCFEIRTEGGEKFISLLDMKRPFTPMKKLDMEKVISDIVEKIKG